VVALDHAGKLHGHMSRFMLVTKPDEGSRPDEIAQTLPPYTFDGVYYIHFSTRKVARSSSLFCDCSRSCGSTSTSG